MLKSPQKTDRIEFLRYLRENNYISVSGIEYVACEVDYQYFESLENAAQRRIVQLKNEHDFAADYSFKWAKPQKIKRKSRLQRIAEKIAGEKSESLAAVPF
jgi:hypothetical protein